MLAPQRVDLVTELLQASDFVVFQGLGPVLAPGLEAFEVRRVAKR